MKSNGENIKELSLPRPIVYVARDIERALGEAPGGDYYVIANDSAYGRKVQAQSPDNVWLIESEEALDTHEILSRPEVAETITKYGADVVVFQSNARIERIARERGWNLLNPSAELAKRVEEKVSQVAWLGDLARYLPPHVVTTLEKAGFSGARSILQFNHSHTGEGTFVIESESDIAALREKFPKRECRIVSYIEGPVFTTNVVVGDEIRIGNISLQITGLRPFTDLPFSTIGNDWALPRMYLSAAQKEEIAGMARAIGARLRKDGWRGLFGIDVIVEEKTGATYLLEINARQPASTTLESILQAGTGADETTFAAHLAALQGVAVKKLQEIRSGAQIVQRVTRERTRETARVDQGALEKLGLAVLTYPNTEPNKDLVRITSAEGIMKTPTKLNDLGKAIASHIS